MLRCFQSAKGVSMKISATRFFLLAVLFAVLLKLLLITGCHSDKPETDSNDQDLTDAEIAENDPETVYDFSSFDFDSYNNEVDHLIIAYFEVENGTLGQVILPEIEDERYENFEDSLDYTIEELVALQEQLYIADLIWEAVVGLIPNQYLGQIAYFEIFTDGYDNFLGAIEEIEGDTGFFIFSLDLSDMLDEDLNLNADLLFDTITHELAHIISLNADQVAWVEEEDADPATYFVYEYDLDTFPDSYLNLFFQRFWKDLYPEWSDFYYQYGVLYEDEEHLYEEYDALLQDYLEEFHDRYADQFVSEYAATSPAEDLAESFMIFVLQDKPEGNLIRDQKVRFFYDFPEMIAARDHARQYLKSIDWL
jgi:hypothetical protein